MIPVPANAANRSATDAANSLPSMRGTILGWFQPLTLGIVRTMIESAEVIEQVREITTSGVVQPLSLQQLSLKSEGERKWRWFLLHTVPETKLEVGGKIVYRGRPYRVMGAYNWDDYGYRSFELVEDYNVERTAV